jgi:cation transport regulator ChaB
MPKLTKAQTEELPATLKRSPAKAQRTFAETHDAAVEQYGEGERAHRTAFASLKRGYEKVGDHWEPKDEKGPSDESVATAKRLDVPGRSRMSKDELVDALQKANAKATRASR